MFLAAATLLLAGPLSCRRKAGPATVIINGRGWVVDLAVTGQQRYEGLSGRRSLLEGTGMLFIFPDAKVREFCMRGCTIPLDIAFVGPDMRVVKIHTMTVEPDLAGRTAYSSDEPAQYALEVEGGSFEPAGVAVGQLVTFAGDIPEATKAEHGP